MIRTHLKTLIITSLLILLPIPVGLLLWDQFPVEFTTSQLMTVWLPSLSLLAGHWFCILFTALDPGHKGRNKKPLTLVLWLMPLISWFCSGLMYALYLGSDIPTSAWCLALMGIMFTAIGNYLPKTKMNYTVGIKVSWAYSSEENWNATHRFAGKVWVIGGILMLLGIFLPEGIAIALMFLDMAVLCILPVVYSWQYWKKQKAEGVVLKNTLTLNPKLTKVSIILLAVILIFTLSIMFSGDLKYTFGDDRFNIEADWYSDLSLRYDAIEDLEYREESVPGLRVGGFGSFRLLMGFFENEEFGTYTRYTYYDPEACIILKTQRQTFVLSAKTARETHEIYNLLLKHAN